MELIFFISIYHLSTQNSHLQRYCFRGNRRKILNEEEMVKEVEDLVPTDIINFIGMSFKEQVQWIFLLWLIYDEMKVSVYPAFYLNVFYSKEEDWV